jgi:signal transduction histidine kinase
MITQQIKVLLVEDNPGDAFLIKEQLSNHKKIKFEIVEVQYLKEAINCLEKEHFDIILLDIQLPDSRGIETLLNIEKKAPSVPVVILTGMKNEELAIQALRQGTQDYLIKGETTEALLVKSIRYAIERKYIEEQLKQHSLQLEAVNRDLEAFSYTVSHDLRNPVTIIRGMSSLLLKQNTEHPLSQEQQHYIQHIHKASFRIEQIIEDLMLLSQVKKSQLQTQLVNFSAIAQQITSQLQQKEPERQVEFVIQPEIMVRGDEHLLHLALENLLNNAWKYTKDKIKARIEFGSNQDNLIRENRENPANKIDHNSELVYFVKDNGVGFDMEKAEGLFMPFQRLENAKKFEGTGIGLATVKRIINRHGGRIWAEATVDGGATFYFTLTTIDLKN